MAIADPLLWGFASMFAWGTGDILARYAAIRLGSPVVAIVVLGLGIVPPLAMGLSRYPSLEAVTGGDFLLLATASGLLFPLGYVLFYRGLERGMVSIVSPLSASWLAVTTVLAAILFNESIGLAKGSLILLVLAGIVLISARGRSGASLEGVWYGLTAMLTFGIAFTLWKPIVEEVGPFIAVASVRLVATVALGSYLSVKRPVGASFTRGAVLMVIASAVLDSLGFVSYNLGIETEDVSLIAPISASYPVVTLVLAWVFLRERVSALQMTGIVVLLSAVVALGVVG